MSLKEQMLKDLEDVFFEDFSIMALYSKTGLIVKIITQNAVDMASGYQYEVITVKKSDIGEFDPSQTFTIEGVVYGLVNETVNDRYTDLYSIRLNKKGI